MKVPGRIRIGLVDDHSLVRDGIKSLLAIVDTVEVIGEAENGHEALHLVEQTPEPNSDLRAHE